MKTILFCLVLGVAAMAQDAAPVREIPPLNPAQTGRYVMLSAADGTILRLDTVSGATYELRLVTVTREGKAWQARVWVDVWEHPELMALMKDGAHVSAPHNR